MKICIAQIYTQNSNIKFNKESILAAIKKANEADLVVFPELSLLGYPANDHLFNKSFIKLIDKALTEIIDYSFLFPHLGILIGLPEKINDMNSFYNSAYLINNGKIISKIHKHLLPNNDIFNEKRYFQSGPPPKSIVFKGKCLAIHICEDMWYQKQSTEKHLKDPIDELAHSRPDLFINLSASPFRKEHYQARIERAKTIVKNVQCPFIYVNTVALNDNVVFDGQSFIIKKNGKLCLQAALCKADYKTCSLNTLKSIQSPSIEPLETLKTVICFALKDYLKQSKHNQVILGLSGGIDSALVATLAVLAIGKENVKGLLMPSKYSSQGSLIDAAHLAENLGISTQKIPISTLYEQYQDTYKNSEQKALAGIADENVQARIRGNLVMMWANAEQRLALPTGNKSELALGYCTLYGDMCGSLSLIGDLYKTEVYSLARYLNQKQGPLIPLNSIQKAPSAELRPDQKDSDSLPPYKNLDLFLEAFLEKNLDIETLQQISGLSLKTISELSKVIKVQEFKRKQAAPVLKLSSKAFGFGRQIPILSHFHFEDPLQ